MLVSPVLDVRHASYEHQKERCERPDLVDLVALIDLHPPLDLTHVANLLPSHQIYHHHAGVEVARLSTIERVEESPVRPKVPCYVNREVGVAVLRCSDHSGADPRGPKLGDIIDHDEVWTL
jgi:hypothetical protein